MKGDYYPERSSSKTRIEYHAFRLLGFLIARLPPRWAFRAGEWLGWLSWLLMPRRRGTVARNLRIAFAGEMSDEAIARLARDSMIRSGANLVSSIRTARLSREELAEAIEIRGAELLVGEESPGRGTIVLLSHKGNWEVLSRLGALVEFKSPVGAYYRPLNNRLIDRWVLKSREADGMRMFSKRDSALHVSTFLRDGGVLGILADQRAGIRGETVSFFGKPTRASPLPALLARRSGCRMVSLEMQTLEPGRWRLNVTEVSGKPSTARCMAAIEADIRSSPVDYFWLQDRWKMQVRPDIPLGRWLGPKPVGAPRPLRVLLWLPDEILISRLDEEWFHPDARYEVAMGDSAGELPDAWTDFPRRVVSPPEGVDAVREAFRRLDRLEAEPIDMILTSRNDRDTRKAAKRELIPMVVLG